jgi:hypothetical protein
MAADVADADADETEMRRLVLTIARPTKKGFFLRMSIS